jgi:hypothetical protein
MPVVEGRHPTNLNNSGPLALSTTVGQPQNEKVPHGKFVMIQSVSRQLLPDILEAVSAIASRLG